MGDRIYSTCHGDRVYPSVITDVCVFPLQKTPCRVSGDRSAPFSEVSVVVGENAGQWNCWLVVQQLVGPRGH